MTPAADDRATRLLVAAPGHNLWDERVLRTVRAGSRVHRCTLALDAETLAAARPADVQRARERLGDGVDLLPLPAWPRVRGLSRLTRHLYAHRIARQARALRPMNETPVVAAALGNDAGIIGAATMALLELEGGS